jgi:hypothetical protein
MDDQQDQILSARDNETGKTIRFQWHEPTPPTEDDLAEVFAAAKTQPEGPPEWQGPLTPRQQFEKQLTTPDDTRRARAAETAWEALNPVNIVKGAYQGWKGEVEAGKQAMGEGRPVAGVAHTVASMIPILGPALANYVPNLQEEFGKAKAIRAEGDVTPERLARATGHVTAGLIPVVGPAIGDITSKLESGDTGGAAGTLVGLGLGPKIFGAAVDAVPAAARAAASRLPVFTNPNPMVAAAVKENLAAGVPVDAGAATGSAVIKTAQDLADASLGGLVAGARKTARTGEEALTQRGSTLAGRVSPNPATAEQAGLAVEQAVEGRGGQLQSEANRSYGALRAIEQQTPITVDMRPVKAALQPIYDRMVRQMPIAKQQASEGLKALQNILTGGDVSPLSVADADLGAIKGIARGADAPWLRDVSQGLAAKAVGEFDAAVQQAVQRAGPAAEQALAAGRAATKAKYATAEVLDGLRRGTGGEAAKMFGRMVARGDTGIEQLREVAKIAPQQMPSVGRAFLDGLFEETQKEGGFRSAKTVFEKWNNLGPETRKLLFPDQALRSELDNFFLVAKKMQESANPSRSMLAGTVAGQTTGLFMAPLSTLGSIGTGAVFSKLMHNPTAVRLMTEGMQLGPRSPRSLAIQAQLQRLAQLSPVLPRQNQQP